MSRYFDKEEHLKATLLCEEAEKVAKDITSEKDRRGRLKLKAHQLRRFFNEFKGLQRKLDTKTDKEAGYRALHPIVKMTIAKVKYAKGRDLVPGTFVDWFEDCVQDIKDVKSFEAFVLHFEAVVGYCYGLGLKD